MKSFLLIKTSIYFFSIVIILFSCSKEEEMMINPQSSMLESEKLFKDSLLLIGQDSLFLDSLFFDSTTIVTRASASSTAVIYEDRNSPTEVEINLTASPVDYNINTEFVNYTAVIFENGISVETNYTLAATKTFVKQIGTYNYTGTVYYEVKRISDLQTVRSGQMSAGPISVSFGADYLEDWITFPAGGEHLNEGRGYNVTWDKDLISATNIKLSLYRNGVVELIMIDENGSLGYYSGTTPPLTNDGSQIVYMPNIFNSESNRYGWQIKIESADNSNHYDFSEEFEVLNDD